MGKAAIYNPYLDTLGGGERYTLTFAKVLAEEGYDVDIEWNDISIKEKLSQRFGLKLSDKIKVVNSVNRGEGYDIIFWVSDGSIPTLRAVKNYIHFQFPFHDVNGRSLLNKMKLFRIEKNICNSNFTKKVIDQEYGINSVVLYPPVATDLYKPKKKVNQICYVSRFSNLTQNKGHDVLIKNFKKLSEDQKFKDWKLVLAGGVEVGADEYLRKLKKLAEGLNVEFLESPNISSLQDVFGKSKIFWSAAGYGESELNNPEKVEHFGISLVEAMSAGCVPIVYEAGGYREIIHNEVNGFLWNEDSDLISITKKVAKDNKLRISISKESINSSKRFDYPSFKESVFNIVF